MELSCTVVLYHGTVHLRRLVKAGTMTGWVEAFVNDGEVVDGSEERWLFFVAHGAVLLI